VKAMKKRLFSSDCRRFRLLLTLELAVMLPAAALLYINFRQLHSMKREKKVEATIHRDFLQMLAISEKKLNEKAYNMAEEVRRLFPSPDSSWDDKKRQLDSILSKNPWLAHVFFFDAERGILLRTQPRQLAHLREEHEGLKHAFDGWFRLEGKTMLESIRRRSRPYFCYTAASKRSWGETLMTHAFFPVPQSWGDRVVLGGLSFDPEYMNKTFFPEALDDLIARKATEEGGNRLAMMVYPTESEGGNASKVLASSAGWTAGNPEVSRNLDDVFRGMTLGIKFQGTSAETIARNWAMQSFLILLVVSVVMIGGLVLTYHSVSKELALARLKSDFVSNVSHELRTPLALIRLYAETLELGRIKSQEKANNYYCIIRKESERLTALINNILDFSRIEAGAREYDFRETDLADLVRNTLDAYRFQIEQQGFAFEQNIDASVPAVHVDREAIARALLNLVNNALKYSADEKFLCVRLYRANGDVKLEVIDRGIGISRREQSKIFEKFYRTEDPLVHNTKGTGLGLALVRHITNAHGGDVVVESTPGKGSKFTLSLPLSHLAQPRVDSSAKGAAAS
jgi:signal transduction histidine kinase